MTGAAELIEKLYKAVNVVCGEMKAPWDYGIGIPLYHSEIHLLDAVISHKKANAGELAKLLGISNAAVSQVAKKLVDKGLIEAYQIADNQKEVFFKPTNLGQKASAGHKRHHKKIYADFFTYYERLMEEDIAVIEGFLDAVIRSVPSDGEKLMKDPGLYHRKSTLSSIMFKVLKYCRGEEEAE
ncbi:MAG: MarR family transcriptional regulator [Puniceicoccales bacterium]|jgi:DNA-binding MarR family transcriptional regulator|nr:MarR family transcriptional regulator [Puniceicoccales bacterium]